MFPWSPEFVWDAGHVIFFGAFYSVLAAIAGGLGLAAWRAFRDARDGRLAAVAWHAEFEELHRSARACRHQLTGEAPYRVCEKGFDCRGCAEHVRVSGALAPEIARRLIGRLPAPRHATFAAARNAAGQPIDEGLALYFPEPRSYTGEHCFEFQGHGGPVVLHAVLSACLDAGARLAQPGEFTRRAFLNGLMDLAQAEAVADLIDAASAEAARSAMRSLSGEFSDAIHALAAQLVELRALTEATLDFPEEQVDTLHHEDARDGGCTP